jgi:hypothetical protein
MLGWNFSPGKQPSNHEITPNNIQVCTRPDEIEPGQLPGHAGLKLRP